MPVTPTYPGVYIEEIPSGVRTITGVATSTTAFLGRAPRGKTDEPTLINSFADYQRLFGGLHVDYPMSYAVKDFYTNGGKQALIVRLFKPEDTGKATFTVPESKLDLEAAGPGTWGNKLSIKVDHQGLKKDDEVAEILKRYGLAGSGVTKEHLFNLTVIEMPPDGPREMFRNVSLHPKAGARCIDRVLEQESQLVRFKGDLPAPEEAGRPPETEEAKDPTKRETKPEDIAYFQSGADSALLDVATDFTGNADKKTGMYALGKADLFNLLCIPPDIRGGDLLPNVYQDAMQYCVDRRAMLIVDPPAAWGKDKGAPAAKASAGLPDLGLSGLAARNAALYFPRVIEADPLREGQLDTFVPCGIVAGVMARTDVQRGVWKAPAGLDAALNGIQALQVNLNDDENGQLNPLGINCLRFFPVAGRVVWGARTLRGADQLADEYKYIPVRRLALYIEESLYRGTKWVVFEPNDEPLWAQIRLNVGAFMHNLFRQGAFQGTTPKDAYFVKCDKETTTQNDINLGIVNIVVGFAPLKPAEFVIIKLQQMAGQIEA
jgi:phage tail sheath protein FI